MLVYAVGRVSESDVPTVVPRERVCRRSRSVGHERRGRYDFGRASGHLVIGPLCPLMHINTRKENHARVEHTYFYYIYTILLSVFRDRVLRVSFGAAIYTVR